MQEFTQAMSTAGIQTDDAIIADGKLHRVHVEGDSRGSKNGYYVLHDDNIAAGAFGSWKLGINGTWCEKSDNELDTAQAEEIRRKLQEAVKQREQEQQAHSDKAAKLAQRIWSEG